MYTWEYVTDHYDWVDSDCRRFVYYNWLPLLEIQVTNPYSQGVAGGPPAESAAILRKYTWGLDLAGQNGSVNSIDAAGGIGGLLACYDTNCATDGEDPTANDKQYIYFYDANGNVGQVIDWTNAAVSPPSTAWSASRMVATYEYDPYGNVTASAGDYADDNPFRFSTKYWDDETGLGYWGYRYYSTRLGRWISRDLVELPNMYYSMSNNPISLIDPDGRLSVYFPNGPICPQLGKAGRPLGGENLGPPGDCTKEQHDKLYKDVVEFCKKGKREAVNPSRKCPTDEYCRDMHDLHVA